MSRRMALGASNRFRDLHEVERLRVRRRLGGLLWLTWALWTVALVLLITGPAWSAEPPAALEKGQIASYDLVGGGSEKGAWAVGVALGTPWSTLRGQVGLGKRLSLLVDLDTAAWRRWDPGVGLGVRILDRPRGRLFAELILGYQVQVGGLPQQGPTAALRLRLLGLAGRVCPYLWVGTRNTLLFDRLTVIDGDEQDVTVSVRHRYSPHFGFGVVVGLSKWFGFDVGVDWHFADWGFHSFSLPGIHLGLQAGGGR